MLIKVLQKEPEGWPLTPEFMICYSSRNTIEKSSRSLLLKDNCILISGHIALTCNFISKAGDYFFIFQLFTKVQSTQLGVFAVSQLEKNLQVTSVTDTINKCVLLSINGQNVVISLLHVH